MRTKNLLSKTLFTLLISLGINTIHAQTLEWAKSFGGSSNDGGYSITIDAAGNVYTTGRFQGTVDFDPGSGTANLTSVGSFDIFVQKLDASGNFLWAKSFGAGSIDEGFSLAVDALGNVYTTGRFEGTIDFDPGVGTFNLTSTGSWDIFIQKLDASGNFLWAKSFGGNSNDFGYSLAVDASGNVYTTGFFFGTVDFDPGAGIANLTSAGSIDIFIQKLDASGNFIWAKSFGGGSPDASNSIFVDASGNIYTTGRFEGTVDFDPGAGIANLTSAGSIDIFIQKLDTSGNFIWAKSLGGSLDDEGLSITVDALGNVYTTGRFEGTADFDSGTGTVNLTSAGNNDVFIHKLDASGNFVWATSFGRSTSDEGLSIAVDASGNVYTIGHFFGTVDFDPGAGTTNLTSAGASDIFVQKLDAFGNFLWATSFGGGAFDEGTSIILDASDNIYTTGSFGGTVDFDPGAGMNNLIAVGSSDVFIHKMSQCSPTTGTDVQTACGSYTWIDGITYTTSNNTATYTLTNAAGCDSIVTLNLTINTVSDLTTTLTGETITATNSNATYQWLDCDSNNAEIVGETGQTFTAAINGNYAVEITENGCVDTSACVAITTIIGVLESSFDQTITVFPNPTTGLFMVDLGEVHESAQLTVRDAVGRLVQTYDVEATSMVQISLDQPSGIYFIEIASGEKTATLKLIKE